LPLAFASGTEAQHLEKESPSFVFSRAQIEHRSLQGVVYDAAAARNFGRLLFDVITKRRTFRCEQSESFLVGRAPEGIRFHRNGHDPELSAARTEQRNTLINYGDKFILKLFRRLESGVHPALESAQFLAEKKFPNVPPFAGALELHGRDGVRTCLGIMSGFIPDSKNGWDYTFDTLRRYFDRARTLHVEAREELGVVSVMELAERGVSDSAAETVGTYIESARLLGQ